MICYFGGFSEVNRRNQRDHTSGCNNRGGSRNSGRRHSHDARIPQHRSTRRPGQIDKKDLMYSILFVSVKNS